MVVKNYTKKSKKKWIFYITNENLHLLKTAAKNNGHTMAAILNSLIEQKLSNPINRLTEENRLLAIKINRNRDEIERLIETTEKEVDKELEDIK